MKSLFDEMEDLEIPEPSIKPSPAVVAPSGDMKPRHYQESAIAAVHGKLETDRSTLYVMATGTGKTVTFGHIAKPFIARGRVLVLAHRQELIYQAQRTMRKILGFEPVIEMVYGGTTEGATICTGSYTTCPIGRASKSRTRFSSSAI